MHRHGSLKKLKTFLLLLITLHVAVHTVLLTPHMLDSLEEQISVTCSANAGEDDPRQEGDDFKPPKHSFIDYATYFNAGSLRLAYLPHETRFSFAEPFTMPPQVYLDIFAPPQNCA